MDNLINTFLDHDVTTVSGELTLILHEAADEGDELSIRILKKMGEELGRGANSVIKRVGELDNPITIALTGSVLQKGRNKYLLKALRETIEKENGSITLANPEMLPVYGSILLGMDYLHIPITEDIYEKFNAYGGEII
jgi:N-acetylglucosamine kinase-like BadF-type ATPase